MLSQDPARRLPGHKELLEDLQQLRRRFAAELTPEERLEGLAPEDRLKGLPPEDRLKGLAPEDRLKGLTPQELARLRALLNNKT